MRRVNCLKAAQACGARHFVLLSAFCVAKPDLGFQVAKLKTEASLKNQMMSRDVGRPTAFFKSLPRRVEMASGAAGPSSTSTLVEVGARRAIPFLKRT